MKSIFNIGLNWEGRVQTIKEISELTYKILFELFQYDSFFKNIEIEKESKKYRRFFDLGKNSIHEVICGLADTILLSHTADIKKWDNVKNPTIDFSRSFGFSFVISVKNEYNKTIVSFLYSLGNNQGNGIGFISPMNGIEKDFGWYFDVMKIIQVITKPIWGIMYSNGFKYNTKIKYPLGWITYLSKECEIILPDNLYGFEYEFTDQGKYIISTRDDFTVTKELYQEQIEKLINAMEYIGENVPGYIKK